MRCYCGAKKKSRKNSWTAALSSTLLHAFLSRMLTLLHSKIFPAQPVEEFHASVRSHLKAELEGLDPIALLTMKKLIQTGLHEKNNPDAVNLRETYAQAERFSSGIPTERFIKLATKEIRHKL